MRFIRLPVVALLLAAAMGCIVPQKLLDSGAKPVADLGYVGGLFSGRGTGVALVFVDRESGSEYLMPFFKPTMILRVHDHEEALQIMAIPPGTYELVAWATYDPLSNVIGTREEFPADFRAMPRIEPGKVLFVGRYKAQQTTIEKFPNTRISYSVLPMPYDRELLQRELAVSYPEFSLARFEFVDHSGKRPSAPAE